MMTLDEMKLAVCGKLPGLITYDEEFKRWHWVVNTGESNKVVWPQINWPTEGLQVCHEAEKLLTYEEQAEFSHNLYRNDGFYIVVDMNEVFNYIHATYEQRLEALCRVWFPERFV